MDWVALFALPAILIGTVILFVLRDRAAVALDSAGVYNAMSAVGTGLVVFGIVGLVAVDVWRAANLLR